MGNSHHRRIGMMYSGFGDCGINRSGWKKVSDSAEQNLEIAKKEFVEMVKKYSFDTASNKDYKFTKKHAVKLHLVSSLRPKFNRYAQKFGAKTKWVKLTETEKRSYSKYKNRKSAIYFCDITIDRDTKNKLAELEPEQFRSEYLLSEISLYTKLTSIGVPEIDSLGWILSIPKYQKIEEIPKIRNLQTYLDEKSKEMEETTSKIPIETTDEYKNDDGKNVKKKRKKRIPTTVNHNYGITNVTSHPRSAFRFIGQRRAFESYESFMEQEDEEWLIWNNSAPKKKRRIL